MINSVIKIIQGIVKLRGGTDGSVIGNSTDKLKIIDESAIAFLSTIASALGGGPTQGIYRFAKGTNPSKTETPVSTTYIVPAGKKLLLNTFFV